ncbi:MAG: hypothetical protein SV375_09225, partial [Thermodesulfobacteriota bacterium]|nr:hypothetical protein [Thermodesulfobacteriota bacterium]
PECWYVIVKPPLQVSTAWVYGNLKFKLTTGEYDYISDYLKERHFTISPILENDLETVTSSHFPIIDTVKKRLIDAGAEGAIMTGSGPSVFGVFPSSERAVAAKQFLISQDLGHILVTTGWEKT